MEHPLVSVVLTAHNAESTIADAMSSVQCQELVAGEWEGLICDDASSDRTRVIANALIARDPARWRMIALPHGGPAAARNRGIGEARGEFIAFLDDDDTWEPTKLARCVTMLRERHLDIVCHSELWRAPDGSRSAHHYSPLFDNSVPAFVSLMRGNPFSTSAVVVRRERLLAAGLFDTTLPSAEDYDMWIRLAMLPGIRIGFIDEVLGTYALRAGSESSKVERRMRAMLAIGARYSAALASASPRGRLESWMFRAKVYFTTGVRYVASGSTVRGISLIIAGLAMWPFRFDWLREAGRRLAARRAKLTPAGRVP